MSRITIIERLTKKDITAMVIAHNGLFVKNGEIRVRLFGEDITDFIIFGVEEDPQEPAPVAPVKKETKKGPRQFKGFEATGEKVKVCFNGWDGKSYNGESEVLPVYKAIGDTRYNRMYVAKYTAKWGWTMHKVMTDWAKIGKDWDAYEVDFCREVEVVK